MTKEQALEKIREESDLYPEDSVDSVEWLEVYKALEQPTSDDCVSRTEVIDELNRLGRNAFKDDTDYDNFFAFVDSLPPVTPTHGTCKDCEHWDKDEEYCKHLSTENGWSEDEYYQVCTDEDFYCKEFKKRGNKVGWSSLENVREKVERGDEE